MITSVIRMTGSRGGPTHQIMPIQISDRLRCGSHLLKLDKAHRPIDLLPETHPLETLTSTEQRS